MVGIPAASSTLTVVASTPGRLRTTAFYEPLHFSLSCCSCAHVEVTLRATSRRATGMAMLFTAVQKIVLLGAAAAADQPSGANASARLDAPRVRL
jgi:hypothetical protein